MNTYKHTLSNIRNINLEVVASEIKIVNDENLHWSNVKFVETLNTLDGLSPVEMVKLYYVKHMLIIYIQLKEKYPITDINVVSDTIYITSEIKPNHHERISLSIDDTKVNISYSDEGVAMVECFEYIQKKNSEMINTLSQLIG